METFKKYQNITTLTRDVIEELIKMIYVEHGGGIRIEFNFKDAFKEAVDILVANSDKNVSNILCATENVYVI